MIANPQWEKIIETDASDIGFGGILKQIDPQNKQEYLVRFYSGKWNNAILEFLKRIKDPNLRTSIIDQMEDIPSTSKEAEENYVPPSNISYSMTEVNKLLKNRYTNHNTITIEDLSYEIDNLKNDIKILKRENFLINNRISDIEKGNEKGKNIIQENFEEIVSTSRSMEYQIR